MIENDRGLYEAFRAKDARFDGRFFVGISSTGIYCRPVCRAKQAKEENCTFFHTAAEAEQAGYRPCLLCRPELAPSSSITNASTDLVYRATKILEENCGSGQSMKHMARQLGCTDRHLRRVFMAEHNISPIQYVQTCRLLLAKNLLTDTNLSVLDVAMSAGFGSLRRFNDVFKRHYKLSPTTLRKYISKEEKYNGNITLALGYRPPYLWQEMLNFLDRRTIAGIEVVKNGEYMRTVRIENVMGNPVYGWVRVGHISKKNVISVTVSETLLPVLPQVLARIRRLFDLYCDPDTVYETLHVMNTIRPGLYTLGTRVPGCFDSFEMAVHAVLGQQITVKSASTLASRIVEIYGAPIQTGIEGLTHIFPSPSDILSMGEDIANNFGTLGVTSTRSNTILELTRAMVQGKINLDFPVHPEKEITRLTRIGGIGSWTAHYIAMRVMGWPDAFLETDIGVKKALQPYVSKDLFQAAESWRPWRSYATISLWNTL